MQHEVLLADNPNIQRKLLLRMEQVARYRVAMIPNYRVAALVGMTEMGLYHLMQRAEYRAIEDQVRVQVLEDMDNQMRDDRMRALKRDFDKIIPEVFNTVVGCMRQNKDLKTRMAAAQFLADRDPGRRMVHASHLPSDSDQRINRVYDVQADTIQFMNNTSQAMAAAPDTNSITTKAQPGPVHEPLGDMAGFTKPATILPVDEG